MSGGLMLDFLHHIDIIQLTRTAGYIGLVAIILCETGLFLGFFLPGDSLLFSAGLLASQQIFNIFLLTPLLIAAAIVGYAVAYWFGDKIGHWLLKRQDTFWFKRRYLTEAHAFYEKHGGKALIIGRLIPVVRTFLPIVAGMAEMTHRRFTLFNVIGALVWCGGVTLAGYYLGAAIPNIDKYILPIVLAIIVISALPPAIHLLRTRYCGSKSDGAV
jgi:membrane-associated protein